MALERIVEASLELPAYSTLDEMAAAKGDEVRYAPLARRARDLVSEWLDVRGRHPGPIWTGQRGPLTISGVTQVVLAAGEDAGIPGLRPQRARHTFATRLRQGGADPAQVQALLGHASIDTAARYFRAGQPRTPKSSNEPSATNRPLTSPLPLSGLLAPYPGRKPGKAREDPVGLFATRRARCSIRDRLGQWLADEDFATAFGIGGRPGWPPFGWRW